MQDMVQNNDTEAKHEQCTKLFVFIIWIWTEVAVYESNQKSW